MTQVAAPPRWPDVVWDAAVLRGIDGRARAEIEAAGRLREMRAGDHVYRAGEPADALYVVVEGSCALVAVRRGEADASVIRSVSRGDVFGEEATVVDHGLRQMDAKCVARGSVAEVPLAVLRRALGRSGAAEFASRLERALRRAATLDLFRTTAFTRALPDRDLELLLDAAQHEKIARGDHVYREGDEAPGAYLVADGLLQAQSEDGGAPRVEGYLTRGDVFGDDELEDRSRRRASVVASGPAWVVGLPRDVFLAVARRNVAILDGVRRVRTEALPAPLGMQTTAHVFQDLYRMRVARSLLVIDQDSCIRCGHCAWSCASTHDDGISRLVRRGDKVLVRRDEEKTAPLLVPNSCQHCKNPSCMIDCPTGAIGRDARGEVFIREELCTGCGLCAKACPWDNIQIAPRSDAKHAFPEVAVKCDLCSSSAGGPACVNACPTQAIARIDPNQALVELRGAPKLAPTAIGSRDAGVRGLGVLPARAPAWPWVLGGALAAAGVALSPIARDAFWSGVIAACLVALLVAYAALKRTPRILARVRGSGRLARAAYVAHLSLGALVTGATLAHTHARAPGNAAGALAIAMALALASGAFGALVNVAIPRRLSRLERKSVLPEELAARRREIDEKIFARLSGKSEVVKAIYGRLLRPYRGRRLGSLWLVVGGRSLREEEKALRAHASRLLEGRKSERLDGLDELVKLVVEHRAAGAQRLLTFALRGWLGVHLASTAIALVLLVAHVVAVMVRR
ncbi:MAG: cyclic nucleotide-binding domain-containing protein [Labilithrix sp.]|nr:cyclic nucleotide-binding domain-containing protein [Labilithrix sp.]